MPRPPHKFCSQCGRDGVFTRECHPPVGKAVGVGTNANEAPAPQVTFMPRSHIQINICNQSVIALVDTGSEISFINRDTVHRMQELRFVPDDTASQARLADDSPVEIPGTVKPPVRIEGQTIEYRFHVLPELESEMLIGDLWGKSNHRSSAKGRTPRRPASPPLDNEAKPRAPSSITSYKIKCGNSRRSGVRPNFCGIIST
ncbi:hypothetical protein P5V15_008349 [Pogonomyrmex californicus]